MIVPGDRLVPRYYDENQVQEKVKEAVRFASKQHEHSREQAATRKINAEAEKLEAEARLTRAQAEVTEARAKHDHNILRLQTLQIDKQIEAEKPAVKVSKGAETGEWGDDLDIQASSGDLPDENGSYSSPNPKVEEATRPGFQEDGTFKVRTLGDF